MAAIPCGKRRKNQAKLNFAIQFREHQPRETVSYARVSALTATRAGVTSASPQSPANPGHGVALCAEFFVGTWVVGGGLNYRCACGLWAGFFPPATAFFRTFTS